MMVMLKTLQTTSEYTTLLVLITLVGIVIAAGVAAFRWGNRDEE